MAKFKILCEVQDLTAEERAIYQQGIKKGRAEYIEALLEQPIRYDLDTCIQNANRIIKNR